MHVHRVIPSAVGRTAWRIPSRLGLLRQAARKGRGKSARWQGRCGTAVARAKRRRGAGQGTSARCSQRCGSAAARAGRRRCGVRGGVCCHALRARAPAGVASIKRAHTPTRRGHERRAPVVRPIDEVRHHRRLAVPHQPAGAPRVRASAAGAAWSRRRQPPRKGSGRGARTGTWRHGHEVAHAAFYYITRSVCFYTPHSLGAARRLLTRRVAGLASCRVHSPPRLLASSQPWVKAAQSQQPTRTAERTRLRLASGVERGAGPGECGARAMLGVPATDANLEGACGRATCCVSVASASCGFLLAIG